jgi:hypothetical protein
MSSSLLVVYGRMGDIVSSMLAADIARRMYGERPDILVHGKYRSVADTMAADGAPIGTVVTTDISCAPLDGAITGLNMSRMSYSALASIAGGYDRYLNCCPRLIPVGSHISTYMAYCAGLTKSPFTRPASFPILPGALRRRSPSRSVCFHFGSADRARVFIPTVPIADGFTRVCLGGKDDPCPSWMDVDLRGCSIDDSVSTMSRSSLVCGSDSLFTHLSGLYGVPTVCIHSSKAGMGAYDRSVYGQSCISTIGESNFRNAVDAVLHNNFRHG